ncbi:hypothetical protein Tco_0257164 [Tanacetum coccineum]
MAAVNQRTLWGVEISGGGWRKRQGGRWCENGSRGPEDVGIREGLLATRGMEGFRVELVDKEMFLDSAAKLAVKVIYRRWAVIMIKKQNNGFKGYDLKLGEHSQTLSQKKHTSKLELLNSAINRGGMKRISEKRTKTKPKQQNRARECEEREKPKSKSQSQPKSIKVNPDKVKAEPKPKIYLMGPPVLI